MVKVLAGVLRRILTLSRQAASHARRLLLGLAYPGLSFGPGVTLGRGVRIRVTDGGRCHIGARTAIEPGCLLIVKGGELTIGPDGFIGQGSVIACCSRIGIGPDALIGEHVTIRDQDHRTADHASPYRTQGLETAPISLGANVWLGAKVTVVKGVSIGDGAVIGAGAVVTRSLPARCHAVGVPARPISDQPGEG